MHFTKMQGAGNDYVYVDCFKENLPETERPAVARRVSDRHFGIGSDGLICICPSETSDVRMDMYNADGSRGGMCGNGIRCVGKYAYEHGLTDKTVVTVETGAGERMLWLHVENGSVRAVRVCMGSPEFEPEKIPAVTSGRSYVNQPIEVLGMRFFVTALSVGNPHAVVFVENTEAVDIERLGPAFESHPLFPKRVNTEFVQVIDRRTLKMRVWERGSGETLACGTGATASLAAAVVCGLTENAAKLILLGGELFVEWDRKENLLYMTGPAEFVFDGEFFL